MIVDNVQLEIQRVEIIRRLFNDKGQIIEERIDYYLPTEKTSAVRGFATRKKKKI